MANTAKGGVGRGLVSNKQGDKRRQRIAHKPFGDPRAAGCRESEKGNKAAMEGERGNGGAGLTSAEWAPSTAYRCDKMRLSAGSKDKNRIVENKVLHYSENNRLVLRRAWVLSEVSHLDLLMWSRAVLVYTYKGTVLIR